MFWRIHVAVKYWNLQSANDKHYQTVHEQSLKWPNLWEDRIYLCYIVNLQSKWVFFQKVYFPVEISTIRHKNKEIVKQSHMLC